MLLIIKVKMVALLYNTIIYFILLLLGLNNSGFDLLNVNIMKIGVIK